MKWRRTERMTAALEHMATCKDLRECERDLWRGALAESDGTCGGGVSHTALSEVAAHIRRCPAWCGRERWAHELAQGSAPAPLPPPKPFGSSDDGGDAADGEAAAAGKAALRARLQGVVDERAYRRMVSNVAHFSEPHAAAALAAETKIAREQMYMAVNLLIAMIACFVVGFYLGGRMFKSREAAYICGAAGLVLALFVEAVLLVITMSRQEAYEAKLRGTAPPRRRARRVVVREPGPIPVPAVTSAAAKKTN